MMGTTCRNSTMPSPKKASGSGWRSDHFKPCPACLVEAPHRHAGRHQSPEEAGVTAAVEGVSGGDRESSKNDQERDQVSHGGAKKGAGKHCRGQSKSQQQTNSSEAAPRCGFRDTNLHHNDVRQEMFRSLGWLPGDYRSNLQFKREPPRGVIAVTEVGDPARRGSRRNCYNCPVMAFPS